MAQGTATAALEASSEMCTLESKEPMHMSQFETSEQNTSIYLQIVQSGAWKLRMKANPLGHPFTVSIELGQ